MVQIFGQTLTRRDLAERVGDPRQVFGVELATLDNGLERGNRVLRFNTGGGLEFEVMVDRAMDLAGMRYHGVPIGWHSPAGFKSPALTEIEAEDGFGWMRSMSGLMNSCGLDHIHAPEVDDASHFNHPPKPTITHGLHGRIAYLPATLTGYGTRWDGDRAFLWATGEVRQGAVFAENLVLERRIEVEVGTATIRYDDTVRNLGFDPTPHAYLWHVNMGWPLVDAGTRVRAQIDKTGWTLRADAQGEKGAFEMAPPLHPSTQQVFDHHMRAGADGTTRAAMINDTLAVPGGQSGLALELAWDARVMPSMCEWQFFKKGNYVAALEPCSTRIGSRKDWREREEFAILGYDETVDYFLELTPHLGPQAIGALEDRIG